jgi:CTP synthase (UTP-ammonia lyase)
MRRKYIIYFFIVLITSTINAQSKRQFIKVPNFVNEQKLYEVVIEKLNTKKKQRLSNL